MTVRQASAVASISRQLTAGASGPAAGSSRMQEGTEQPDHAATEEACSGSGVGAAPLPLPFEGHRRRLPPADQLFADGDREREAQATQHWEVRAISLSAIHFACGLPVVYCWYLIKEVSLPLLLCISSELPHRQPYLHILG